MTGYGYERTFSGPNSMSALPPKADETEGSRRSPKLTHSSHLTGSSNNGSVRPKADITPTIKGRRKRIQPTIFVGDFSLP